MSQKHEAHITVWEDYSWRGTAQTNPHALYVDSESFSVGKEIKDLQNLSRDGRVSKLESQVGNAIKPNGKFTFQPRDDDLANILFSHYQMGTRTGSGPYTYTLVPSKGNPTYTNNSIRGEGLYGEGTGDVYSSSFMKKYFDTNENGGTNSIFFRHGICDKLSYNITSSEDLKVSCDYKFRDVVVGTAYSLNPGDVGEGSYSTQSAWEWFEGTVLVGGDSLSLKSIEWEGNNNLTEKSVMSRRDPDWFAFGDYTTEGNFNLDFPKDGMLQIGSMIGTKVFSIVGTLFKTGTEFLAFDMPYCTRRPFDVAIDGKRVESNIPFKAFEKDGTSPVTITLISNTSVVTPPDLFWDAGTTFQDASRTLGDYGIVDGGTSFTNVSRTLSDYTFADRDL